ncbi:MAG: hypothetical protein WCT77_01970 [Bacteroidota bacterium]
MKVTELRNLLHSTANVISQKNGIFTAKKSYYWGIAKDGSEFADKVLALVPNSKLVEFGNHFHHFVGGAKSGSAKDSYLYVKFTVED